MFNFIKSLFSGAPRQPNLLIKPCPFCGGRHCYPSEQRFGMDSCVSASHLEWVVSCKDCGADGPALNADSQVEAEDNWDTRSPRKHIQITRKLVSLSCPFCKPPQDMEDHFVWLRGRDGQYYITCDKCDAMTPSVSTKEQAIKNWNNET